MPDLASPLGGVGYSGLVDICEAPLTGMITLRGELSATWMETAVQEATGAKVPMARHIAMGTKGQAAWMSPDELLLLCDYATVLETIDRLRMQLADQFALVTNVSDARVLIDIKGAQSRDVLGKLTPADLADLNPMEVRRSRLAQIPAAFWMQGSDHYRLIAFRSVATYALDLLKGASQQGSKVGFY